MSDKASEFLKSGPGRLATGEGGAPRVGKSAFTPEAALADLSTADDPRPQQPAEPLAARKLADEIDPSDKARADGGGQAPSGPVNSGSGDDGPEPFSAAGPAADPAATSELGAAGGAPSASVQPALETPEPLAVMQEQIESLLQQVEVLRTALTDAAILRPSRSVEPNPVATPAASNTTGGDGPGLQAELASARPIDPADAGALDEGSGAQPSLNAPGPGAEVLTATVAALPVGNAQTDLGASALGQAPLTVIEGLVNAPSELAGDATNIVTEPLAAIPATAAFSNAGLIGAGEPALDLVAGLSELAADPVSGAVAGLSMSPAGNAIPSAIAAQPLDAPDSVTEIASAPFGAAGQPLDDVVEQAVATVTEVASTSVGGPVAPLDGLAEDPLMEVTELAPEMTGAPEPVTEPPAEAPPSLESLLANVGAAIVVPGAVSEPAEPKPAPKSTTSEEPYEDADGADFLAGTGLADDPADEEAPTGMLSGPLGGLNTPPPPDPLDF